MPNHQDNKEFEQIADWFDDDDDSLFVGEKTIFWEKR
jgi:hypothetical protein